MESCIRDSADIGQLSKCSKNLQHVQTNIEQISRILNLAGNEVRLKILFLLFTEKKMCPCDLSDVLKMTVPAISQHLKKLKDAEVITSTKTGQTIFYSLNPSGTGILIPILELLETEKV